MAEDILFSLFQKLAVVTAQEAIYLHGVEDQVTSMGDRLKQINAFLKESRGKRKNNNTWKVFVSHLRDLALKGEDVIDIYIYNRERLRRRNIWEIVVRSLPYPIKLHNIGKEIEDINSRFKEIFEDKEKYVTEKTAQEAETEENAAKELYKCRNVKVNEVVGFDHNSTELLNQLTEGNQKLDVSSIFGMGGLGKTTLAWKVYEDDRVKNHFNYRIWVPISENFSRKDLLIKVLKSVMQQSESNIHLSQDFEDLSEEELKEKATKYLHEKRYLVVMDDVWTTKVWDEVRDVFPNNFNGSRILITSRHKNVVLYARWAPTPPYFLPFLTPEESWELLRKRVFLGEECPDDLEKLGRKIAESCNGLPLSIVVLAGLLASKAKEKHIWEDVHSNVKWHLGQQKEKCEAVLTLSYTQLPQYLKPCFLYFGLYPKNFEIPAKQLIQLWIAEGFIQEKDTVGSNMEDVAGNYLGELIDRCLIQETRSRTVGGAKTCGIHDLLRDLCISESAEEKFLKVCTGVDLSSKERTRRLSILRGIPEYISYNPFNPSCARSLLFFRQNRYLLQNKHWEWVFKYSKFVRVLNFGLIISHRIPEDIEKLMYLKYLRIESDYLDDIPTSICNLQYLETLDARGSTLNCLPIEIWKLKRLRNLYLYGLSQSFPLPSDTEDTLSELQILSTVTVTITADPQIMFKLPKLRKLGMKPNFQSGGTLESLHHLHHLQALKIRDCSKLPSGANSLPQTITKITLIRVHLNSMTVLRNLPELRVLKLQNCKFTSTDDHQDNLNTCALNLGCTDEDKFLMLKVLKLDRLSITKWELGRGAMPRLTHLVIKKCTRLTMLPEELRNMTSLLHVEVLGSTLTVARILQQLQTTKGFKLLVDPSPEL